MVQTGVKVLFHSSHNALQEQLNQWLARMSGSVTITGISMDSNQYGHCIAIMYQTGGEGRYYRGHLFFHSNHTALDQAANLGLQEAQAQWGRFVAIGSNEHGHCLCVVEEQS